MKRKRSTPRPGRLKGEDLEALRLACYKRDGGRCVECGVMLEAFPRHPLQENGYHMAHKRNKRMWGDSLSNVESKCRNCHIVVEHNGGKVVRSK